MARTASTTILDRAIDHLREHGDPGGIIVDLVTHADSLHRLIRARVAADDHHRATCHVCAKCPTRT